MQSQKRCTEACLLLPSTTLQDACACIENSFCVLTAAGNNCWCKSAGAGDQGNSSSGAASGLHDAEGGVSRESNAHTQNSWGCNLGGGPTRMREHSSFLQI
jgi:hypothetical protein